VYFERSHFPLVERDFVGYHLQESPKNSPLQLVFGVTMKNMRVNFSPPATIPLKVDLSTLLI
jgi:hypothetical protein